ncbi:putative lipid II flippase FtsW [Reinekea blandensis]|uniref:Probable peptidoglycan glycosyltransferase FtsW n=1 Tax=Reinekea blandensis MED297 TaxID=314283 RepID=A4BFR4_9GAMM|nr:putative lipid II flippase FtsW [Reinekea blandensis]EAR08932.1 Bacterial cell division membrane protein [Reinekea sp. MED297] [Reinekea blandensis MED297]
MTTHKSLPLITDRLGEHYQPLWQPDRILLGSTVSLLLFGLVMIASAGIDVSEQMFGVPYHFVMRHAIYLVVALLAAVFVSVVPMELWRRQSALLLMAGFVLLSLVLLPGIGQEIKGSRRWIDLGPVGFQPSELAKVALILYVGAYLVRRRSEVISSWAGFLKPVFVLSIVVVLLLLEPDFGSVVVILGTVLGMLFLGGVKPGQFFLSMFAAMGAVVLMATSESYRLQRLLAFRDPWADENVYGSGYQLTQSLIAFGRGEWFGVGLGNSMQKLFYLPEAHNDFIVAIIAEELGLMGVLALIAVYSLMIARIFRIGRLAEIKTNLFGAFVCYGIGILFSMQAFINLGVNTGLLPTKGLTLPFISAGGTSLIVSVCLIAMVNRVYGETLNMEVKS